MVDAASRVQLAAAQVQDRHLGRGGRSRRHRLPRHRPAASCAGRRARTASACWSAAAWAARPMSARRSGRSCRRSTCSPTSSRSCACTISMAAATTSTRRASRSWSTSSASTNSARRSRPIGRRRARTRSICRRSEYARIASYFAPPDLVPGPIKDEGVEQRRITDPVFANWLKHNVRPHRVPGYVERDHLAEGAGPHAWRRKLGRRWILLPISPSATAATRRG